MLQSLRFGFATNSSSSHSVVLHPNAQEAARFSFQGPWSLGVAGGRGGAGDDYSLGAQKDKAGYLAKALLMAGTSNSAHKTLAARAAFARHGYDFFELSQWDPGIVIKTFEVLPPDGVPIDLWLDFMLDPCVTIHARPEGADHDPDEAFATPGHRKVSVMGLMGRNPWIRARVDGNALVLFDSFEGTKLRWSRTPYTKATTPELVDVKITDFCSFGCTFCYQGSTTQGQHAPLKRILDIFDTLASMGVFEVALGGGEPLSHPDIQAICEGAVERSICVALTTFDPQFAAHPNLNAITSARSHKGDWSDGRHLAQFSAIGVSVHGASGVGRLNASKTMLNNLNIYTEIVAQTVVGATPMATLERTLDAAIDRDIPMLLLGYKTTGRGAGRERAVNRDTVAKLLRRAERALRDAPPSPDQKGFRLGVDTAFLDAYGDLLDTLDVPRILRSSPEGKFSMYVDAVAGTCGPSSYCPPEAMEPITSLREQFAAW